VGRLASEVPAAGACQLIVTSLSPAATDTPAGVSGQLVAAVGEGLGDELPVDSVEELALVDGLAEALTDGSAVGELVLDESPGVGVGDGLGEIEPLRVEGVRLADGDGLADGDVALGEELGLAATELEEVGVGVGVGVGVDVTGQGADTVGAAVCAFAAIGGSRAIVMAAVTTSAVDAQNERGLFM